MSRLHPERWTYADYLRLPDDGTRCEILEGEQVMTPAPLIPHQNAAENLGWLLSTFVRKTRTGTVWRAPCDVILTQNAVVQPDILFVAKARQGIIEERGVFGPPDLVIEILSPSDPERDTVRKRRIYARHGVREYWIVDPAEERIAVYVLDGRKLVRKASHHAGEVCSLAALPGFSAPLAAIFSRSL